MLTLDLCMSPKQAFAGKGIGCLSYESASAGKFLQVRCQTSQGCLLCMALDGRVSMTVHGACVQLKIVTWANEEVASDALSIHGYERYTAADYALSAWYPPRRGARPPPDQAQPAGPGGRPAGVTKWWADGDEPLFYIVSSKARRDSP